jgi:hypothetical protein
MISKRSSSTQASEAITNAYLVLKEVEKVDDSIIPTFHDVQAQETSIRRSKVRSTYTSSNVWCLLAFKKKSDSHVFGRHLQSRGKDTVGKR